MTRRFTRQEDETFTTAITVENAEGARFGEPQKVLSSLLGALAFDPLQFVRMEPKEQVKTLRAMVPDVDFVMIDAANAADYSKRTELGRTEKSLRAQADAIHVPEGTPTAAIDEAALVAKLEQAGGHNASIERLKAIRQNSQNEIAKATQYRTRDVEELEALKDRMADLEARIAGGATLIRQLEEELAGLPPLPQPIDTSDVRREIEMARYTNTNVRAASTKAQLAQRALEAEVAAGKLTKAIAVRLAQVADAVNKAQLPVPGLSFGDGQVLLNGLPFDQASSAEQLRASMAIAMAGNPKLQVIRVKDGSLLDEEGLRIVAEMAEEHGFQVWMERVETSGKVGFVIEDGALKSAPVLQAAE